MGQNDIKYWKFKTKAKIIKHCFETKRTTKKRTDEADETNSWNTEKADKANMCYGKHRILRQNKVTDKADRQNGVHMSNIGDQRLVRFDKTKQTKPTNTMLQWENEDIQTVEI